MTGLEKILKTIDDAALVNVNAVIIQAKVEADKIIADAKNEAAKKCAEIALKSDTDVKAVISRAESAAKLQEKKKILDAKQQIISNIITLARNSLAQLPDSEYESILLQMAKKNAHNKAGLIQFSKADKARLSVDFDTKLKSALSDKEGAALTVSDQEANIEGGFLLIYGDIEENCTFDALFASAKEELQDKVNSLLFE
ncbi:MAG: V-type ATP synthase subunit E [Mobilitalea sp.]